ncbi:MAG TPA: OmpA family protein [Chthoniobacter sp.]|nr:OmpA family protein [Chthoniobacter sp.]
MSRFGKCQNLSGCLLAYRGEETEVEKDQPFICAECGKPLVEVKSPAAVWMRYVYGLVGIVVLAGVAVAVFPPLRGMLSKGKGHHEAGERPPAEQPPADNNNTPTTDNPPTTAPVDNTPTAPVSEPPKFVTSPQRIEMDVTKGENKTVKAEVLTRVDQMPNVSGGNKDKLYMAVEKARKMGKIITIPFSSGKSELSATDVQQLKTELEKPEIVGLRGDPTAVFVILGYADPKGDAKKNIAISEARADTVRRAMKDKCEVINVMHTVGMGGSKLVDAQNLEKNRIVEIWAVLP